MESEWISEWIEGCGDIDLNEIVKAVIRRYAQCHPEWEIVFYSLLKEKGRKEAIEERIDFLNQYP